MENQKKNWNRSDFKQDVNPSLVSGPTCHLVVNLQYVVFCCTILKSATKSGHATWFSWFCDKFKLQALFSSKNLPPGLVHVNFL